MFTKFIFIILLLQKLFNTIDSKSKRKINWQLDKKPSKLISDTQS